jgi:Ser/Thr protein kinase RdoA (MazF antagonist)
VGSYRKGLKHDLAIDCAAVTRLLADRFLSPVARVSSFRLLKRKDRRLVVRYEIAGSEEATSVVGKWFSDDRGAIVADALTSLTDKMSLRDGRLRVPALIGYMPIHNVVFMETIEGPRLDEALRNDQSLATGAGAWLATFHRSGFKSPRDCGPRRQLTSLRRWTRHVPSIENLAKPLEDRLPYLSDPRIPVHYDFRYSQVFAGQGDSTVVVDFDQAGMGDPAYDLVRFQAQLNLLGIRRLRDPRAFAPACDAFRAGYESIAPLPKVPATLEAFAWLKLAYKRLLHNRRLDEADYALEQARAHLART